MLAGDDAVIMRHQVEANAAYFGVQPIVLEGVAHDLMLVSQLVLCGCACICVRVCPPACVYVCVCKLSFVPDSLSVPNSLGNIFSNIPESRLVEERLCADTAAASQVPYSTLCCLLMRCGVLAAGHEMGAGCTDTAHMVARDTGSCRENLIPIVFPSLLMLNSSAQPHDSLGW